MASHTVRVSSGKYTFVKRELTIAILRNGEPWHQQQDAFNAFASIMAELDAARVVLFAARQLAACGDAPVALRDALRLHDALVDDNESPSGWAA